MKERLVDIIDDFIKNHLPKHWDKPEDQDIIGKYNILKCILSRECYFTDPSDFKIDVAEVDYSDSENKFYNYYKDKEDKFTEYIKWLVEPKILKEYSEKILNTLNDKDKLEEYQNAIKDKNDIWWYYAIRLRGREQRPIDREFLEQLHRIGIKCLEQLLQQCTPEEFEYTLNGDLFDDFFPERGLLKYVLKGENQASELQTLQRQFYKNIAEMKDDFFKDIPKNIAEDGLMHLDRSTKVSYIKALFIQNKIYNSYYDFCVKGIYREHSEYFKNKAKICNLTIREYTDSLQGDINELKEKLQMFINISNSPYNPKDKRNCQEAFDRFTYRIAELKKIKYIINPRLTENNLLLFLLADIKSTEKQCYDTIRNEVRHSLEKASAIFSTAIAECDDPTKSIKQIGETLEDLELKSPHQLRLHKIEFFKENVLDEIIQNQIKAFETLQIETAQKIEEAKQERIMQERIRQERINREQMISQLNALLVSILIKPQENLNIDQQELFNKFIQQNTELKKGLEALKELPFIKDLQMRLDNEWQTDEELVEAFEGALREQRIGIRDQIKHPLHICYKWIYETLVEPYNVKSTLEEKRELNEERTNAYDTFKKFVQDTELQINSQQVLER